VGKSVDLEIDIIIEEKNIYDKIFYKEV